MGGPTFDDVFAVMACASVGDASARVAIPEGATLEDVPTKLGIALNVLLDDLSALRDQHLQTLLDSVQDYAIVMLDPSGRVSSWNSGAERVLGYAADEIVGQSVAVFHPPESALAVAAELAAARVEGRVEREAWRLRKGGEPFWANVVVTPMKSSEGEVIGFAKITRDLSERRQAEESLLAANRELEAFSYSVAHDLRGPLRAINGYAHLVGDEYADKIDAEGQLLLRSISRSASKMGELIDGLLLLARVSRSELHRSHVDLAVISAEVVARLRADEPTRQVDVVIAPSLETDADPRLARALVENLVGNAWKFSGASPSPRIEIGALSAAERRPVFFVRDNGAGFDMAFADKLFKPFQRLHAKEAFPGDGIGLATAHRIVQRHGGRIWGEGKVGGGATFFFTLPTPPA